jgi:tripartite-type tricarboxylate transporter receptor subunit TctC
MRGLCFAALAILVLDSGTAARSQDWPQMPVRIVVPFAPGRAIDRIARILAQRLGETFRGQFIVENRPDAGGAPGTEAVARSPADGHTLLLASSSVIAVVPATTRVRYDPVRDFAPISVIGTSPYVLAVNPRIPARTVAAFVDHVRGQPDKLLYAAPVIGGLSHLAMVLFQQRAAIEMIPVTYEGGSGPLVELAAGHVPVYFAPLADVMPHATSGVIRLLAVSSERRVRQIPDLPTFAESGFPGFKLASWIGLMAPAGTRREVVEALAAEIARAVDDPAFVELLMGFGVEPLGNTPAEFAVMVAADISLWGEAVESAGLTAR